MVMIKRTHWISPPIGPPCFSSNQLQIQIQIYKSRVLFSEMKLRLSPNIEINIPCHGET